ncbi:MAG: DUF4129 domain-containing protein [Anaerolineae bacterium]|nr:DUF4129 domain-containing protein [Anaerolineae bacterium]
MNILLSWREKVICPLIVALMIGCCLFAVAQAVERFVGSRVDLYIITLIGMQAALQSFYTQRLVIRLHISGIQRGLVYLLELVLLLVLSRIGLLISDIITGRPFVFDFFRLELRWVFVIALMVMAWWFARSAAVQFARLHSPPDLESEYIDLGWVSPYDVLNSLFMWGGVMLMLSAGLARMDLSGFPYPTKPPAQGVIVSVVLYFSLGLILLGQARFDSVRRRWLVDRMRIAEHVGSRWLRYSLVLIGLAAVFACLAPVSYTSGLLDAMGTVMTAVFFVINLLFSLIVLIAGLLGHFINLLLGQPEPITDQPSAPILRELQPAPEASAAGTWDWLSRLDWPSIQSALSWLIALAVIIYVGWTYLRDHPQFSQGLEKFRIFRFLARLWRAIWESIVGAAEEAGEATRGAFQRLFGQRGSGRPLLNRLLRLGGSSPRERIRVLYLSTLNRAAGQGIGRKSTQTPYEYEVVLEHRMPESEDDIDQLTEAFVEARYSRHPVGEDDVATVREAWLRLRSALRQVRPDERPRGGSSEKKGPNAELWGEISHRRIPREPEDGNRKRD